MAQLQLLVKWHLDKLITSRDLMAGGYCIRGSDTHWLTSKSRSCHLGLDQIDDLSSALIVIMLCEPASQFQMVLCTIWNKVGTYNSFAINRSILSFRGNTYVYEMWVCISPDVKPLPIWRTRDLYVIRTAFISGLYMFNRWPPRAYKIHVIALYGHDSS